MHPPHHLDAKRDAATLCLKARSQLGELDDHRVARLAAFASEQKSGVDHDRCRTARHGDPGGVVEHPDRHVMLAPAVLGVTRERGEGGVDRERDAGFAGERAEAMGVVPVHPEAVAKVDLSRVVTACDQQLDRLVGGIAGRERPRADADDARPRY